MRVVVASHGCFPFSTGGMERHTYNLAKWLAQSGLDVTVALPESHRDERFPFPTAFFPWPRRPAWLWSNYDFSREVGQWIDRTRPDIAFSQGFALWAYGPRRKIPVVLHPHGLEMFGQGLRGKELPIAWMFRRVLASNARHADRIVSLGGDLTRILRERVGVPESRLVEIPNAVDLSAFSADSTVKTERSLLFVGRLVFNKGLDLLEDALANLPDVPFQLTILDDGPLRARVEAFAKRDPRVRPVFGADEETLRAAYASAEALVFCSRFEGMPTVILEAMAQRCAILATSIGAVPVMFDKSAGIRCEPTSASLATAIRAYFAKPFVERTAMGARGRKTVEARFSWERVADEYLRLFRSLTP